jgi:hypothetical protein
MFETLREMCQALRARKKLALLPIAVILVLLGGLLVVLQGSAIAPFIYALF